MPDTTEIERTIFKLEIDGSAYVEGADKLSASTNKLSRAQEVANNKLKELNAQQASYKKQLADTNTILKENEKETLDLTKQLNDLKNAGKGATVEAKNLQTQLRNITTNTKEFKIEAAALKTNLTATSSAIKVQSTELKAAEAASGKFTAAMSKSFGVLRTLANIIPGIGIGGLVALIAGPLVSALSEWAEGLVGITEDQKQLTAIIERSSDSYGKAVVEVSSMTEKIKLAKEGYLDKDDVLKEYNDTLGRTIGKTNDLDKAEQLLVQHGPDYIQLMFLKAKATAAGELAAEAAKKQVEDEAAGLSLLQKIFVTQTVSRNKAIESKADQLEKDEKTTQDYLKKQQELLEEAAKFAAKTGLNFFPDPKDTGKKRKEATNIYEQELQKLKADIAKIDEKGFTSEETITKAIEEDFKRRGDAFEKALRNKQLTAGQFSSLQEFLKQLQDLTLNAQLKTFREAKQKFLTQINNEITNLQIEESTRRIAAIQDSFERERQAILLETDKTQAALEQKRDDQIKSIIQNAAKSGLKKEDVEPQIQQIEQLYSNLFNDLEIIKNQKLQQLSFDVFEKLTEDARRALDAENLGISEGSLGRIKQTADLFTQGKISYQEYQKELTEIAEAEANERFQVERFFLEQEIKIRQDKLEKEKGTLTDDQIKRLQDEIRRLQKQLADAERGNIIGGNKKPPEDQTGIEKLAAYADAVQKVAASVISFWQEANEAEAKALDRSISLQEKRVEAALRIAERGNAEYLRAEEDRLTELNVQRENAARKQLGIDAALQASQILVGITGAISKIASAPFGAETIAEIAIIIGALATGFGLVKSLQGNQPKLYKGTPYLNRDGAPAGRDTIPAYLNEGEAVIPTDKNKSYHPAVKAIYDGTIPAEDLNKFVTDYHKIKPIPQPDYAHIKEVAELKIGQDGKMSVLLGEQNKKLDEHIELQKLTLSAMKKLGVKINIDKYGLAVSQMEVIEEIKKSRNK